VKVNERTTPLASVVSVSDVVPFANLPLAPVSGALKVTDIPLVGDPPVVTVAIRGAENGSPTVAVCGAPLVMMTATTGGFELTPVTPPQLGRKTIRQTKAKIVPPTLYFIASSL
jgi:hypothetical protein